MAPADYRVPGDRWLNLRPDLPLDHPPHRSRDGEGFRRSAAVKEYEQFGRIDLAERLHADDLVDRQPLDTARSVSTGAPWVPPGLPQKEVIVALSSIREVLVFELGRLRDMEERAGQLLARLGDNVRDDALKRTFQAHEQESRHQVRNINACLESMGSSPVETTSYVVEAIRNSYQEFIGLTPSPRVLELLMVELACWYAEHAVTRYRGLFNIAISLGEHECGRLIVASRSTKEAFISQLRQFSVALTQQETVQEHL